MSAKATAPHPPSRRPRRWRRHLGIGSAALIALAVALIAWLLLTASGRDTVLTRVLKMLPPGSLTWQRADGAVYGPLTLYGVHYRNNGVDLQARRVMLDPSLVQLLGRRLRLDALEIDDAALDLPVDRTLQPLPSWPGSLPKFAFPFALGVERMAVHRLRISREGTTVANVRSIDGGVELAPGVLGLRNLSVASDRGDVQIDGHVDVGRNYVTRVTATARQPQPRAGVDGATLSLRAGGSLDHFVLSVGGHAPDPFALRLALDDGRAMPHWSLSLLAPRLDPGLLFMVHPPAPQAEAGATTLDAIALQADGVGGSAQLHGRIAQDGNTIAIAPSQLAYAQGIVQARPLGLQLLDGDLQLRGRVDLRPQAPVVDATALFNNLRWSATAAATPVHASGELAFAGNFDAWTVKGTTDLLRDKQHAQVTLDGRGDRSQIRFDSVAARTPAGAMSAVGQLRWAPQFAWTADATLAGFDPGYFAPGFEGALSGRVQTHGANAAGVLSLHATVDPLSGQLRGRRLAGRGNLDWTAGTGHTDLDLHLGASHVQASGQFGRVLDLVARFDPLQLDDLLPSAQGRLSGQIALHGDLSAPAIAGQLTGSGLHWKDYGAAHLSLDGKLSARGIDGALRVDADGIAGIPQVSAFGLHVTGSETSPRVDGALRGPLGALALSGSAQRQGALWNGRIATLRYTPTHGNAWTLAAPTTFRLDAANALHLQQTCMTSMAPASTTAAVCADADWPHRANLQARALPLSLLDPWLVAIGLSRPDLDTRAYGNADLDAHIAPATHGGWTGTAQLHSTEGGMQLQPQLAHPLFGYTNLVAQATLEGERLQLRVDSGLTAGGTLHAQLATALAADAAMAGTIAIDLRDITWVELFSTDIAAPKGQLDARLSIGGTRAHPTLSGRIALDNFEAELPALGVALHDGHVALDAASGGATRVSGTLRSGDGTLVLGGALQWNNPDAPLTVTVKGQNVRIADTPELSAIASPDLQLQFASRVLSVRGRVDVPKAQMNLERLDSTVSPSPDVIVLDPVGAARGGASAFAVDVDLALGLGDNVQLKGFGLDGKLGGQLRVRRGPGNPMTATGGLNVSGRYAAYGQQLEIVRGRLGYGGGGFDNPSLDILAQRVFDEATVGVRVRGTALRPQTQIVSTPAMDPSDALAYLVLGRPLRSASAIEGRQISAAAAAMSVGSNLVAQKVAARLGLDAAGVAESRALGGAAFTVGKSLSPRVFISYGVSLIGTGEVLTLKYLLRKGFDIQVESGRENRASINWRIEK